LVDTDISVKPKYQPDILVYLQLIETEKIDIVLVVHEHEIAIGIIDT